MSKQTEIILKKNEERRINAGHLWIFSNEIDIKRTPLKGLKAGQIVQIKSSTGRPIALAYINPQSLISARIISYSNNFNAKVWLIKKIKSALDLREKLFFEPCYRLIYGEGDYLPGLVVDQFNNVLVVQITTAGMENLKQDIIETLIEIVKPKAILLNNNNVIRKLEGLDIYTETVYGEVPNYEIISENACKYKIPLKAGQKTGWFYDQRFTRLQSLKYIKNKTVLDLFSYSGGFGILVAKNKALEVTCVDSSQSALNSVLENAKLNDVDNKVKTLKGDCAKVALNLFEQDKQFDVVLIDPPALIKRKKDIKKGQEAYRAQNLMAMKLVKKGGFLISSSCSQHLSLVMLQNILLQCAKSLKLNLQIVEHSSQAADHPIHGAISETAYLKTLFCRISS